MFGTFRKIVECIDKLTTESNMAVGAIIQQHFPEMDSDIFNYVSSVLVDPTDFDSSDDIFESVGEILLDISGKTEKDVKQICDKLLKAMKR